MDVAPFTLRLRHRDGGPYIIIRYDETRTVEPYTIEILDAHGNPPPRDELDAALEWLLVSVSKLREQTFLQLGRKPQSRARAWLRKLFAKND